MARPGPSEGDEDAVGGSESESQVEETIAPEEAVDDTEPGPFQAFLEKIQRKKSEQEGTLEEVSGDEGAETAKAPPVTPSPAPDPVVEERKVAETELVKERVAAAKEERRRKHVEFSEKINTTRTNRMMDKLASTPAAKKPIKGEIDDSLRSHIEYMRVWNSYQKRLGCQGTGKRLTMATPILEKHAEIEAMREEMWMRRASGILEGSIDGGVQSLEFMSNTKEWRHFLPNTSFAGLAQSWQKAKQDDRNLQEAIVELEIEWSSYLGTRPLVYVALAIGRLAAAQAKANRRKLSGEAPSTADQPEFDDL